MGSFEFYADVPYLWGQNRGVAVQELGNPKFGLDANLLDGQHLEFWLRTWGAVTQPSGQLASRFDTYRAGGEFRYRHSRLYSSMGGGYRFRVNEQDHNVDIGNVDDFNLTMGLMLRKGWAVQVGLDWFRSEGVKIGSLAYARPAEWAGISPGVRYHLGGGFDILTEVTFPVLHSREESEMDIAFWDMSFPEMSQPSLRTQLGARF